MNKPLAAPRAQGGNGVDWKHFLSVASFSGIFWFWNQIGKIDSRTAFWWKLLPVIPQSLALSLHIFSRRKIWVQEFLWVPTEMVPINSVVFFFFFFLFLRKLPWLSNNVTSWQPLGNLQLRDSGMLSLSVGEIVGSSVVFSLPVHSRRNTLFNPFLGSLLGPLENLNSWTFHNPPPPFIFHRHHHWRSIYCFPMTWWDPRIAEGCSENGKKQSFSIMPKQLQEKWLDGLNVKCSSQDRTLRTRFSGVGAVLGAGFHFYKVQEIWEEQGFLSASWQPWHKPLCSVNPSHM